MTQGNNVIHCDDIILLPISPSCDKSTSGGRFQILVLTICINLGVRTTALSHLTVNQFTGRKMNGNDVLRFTESVDSDRGILKGKIGG